MIPIRHVHRHVLFESAIWQWLAAVLAVLILLLMASRVGGAEVRPPRPRLVPPLEVAWDQATQAYRQHDWGRAETLFSAIARELPSAPLAVQPRDPGAAMSRTANVWLALVAHGREQPELALDRWLTAGLPPQTAEWREVARAAALIDAGQLQAASAVLAVAEEQAPENPLVHYYRGLWRLEQATRQFEWPEGRAAAVRLVSAGTADQSGVRSELQELAATGALERAIEYAPRLDRNQPLLPAEWPLESRLLPNVGDLLQALGAQHFLPTAHLTLAQMFLERSNLELAEVHLDAARMLGSQVVFGYRDLASGYASAGRHADAVRSGFKALAYGASGPTDAVRLLEDLPSGLREMIVP
ncbi:MAG: hypothetical protein U0836_14500 [Pirellulales bacterium]